MKEKSYDDLDELLAQLRLRILKLRQTDPATANELNTLFRQLESWIDSLVVDSLKLKGLESGKQRASGSAKNLEKDQAGNRGAP